MAHPNEDIIRSGYDALNAGDMDTFLSYHHEDFVLHYPGRSRFSGEHNGRDGFAALLEQQSEVIGGPPQIELHDVVANDSHAIALQTFRAERDGRSIEDHSVLVFHMRDGKVADIWIHPQDQYAQDEFWA